MLVGLELRALYLLGLLSRCSTSWATPPALFCIGVFEIGFCKLFASGWLRTAILLISASWVARITGMSHWHLASVYALSPENQRREVSALIDLWTWEAVIIWKTSSPCHPVLSAGSMRTQIALVYLVLYIFIYIYKYIYIYFFKID
jgi:hypothetical protein